MSDRQRLVNEHPTLSKEISITEEDSVNEEESPTEEHCLDDALEAWQRINSRLRTIFRSLIMQEIKALKRSAQQVVQCCREIIPQGEQQRDDSITSKPEGASNKRRRVSGYEEDVIEQKSVVQVGEKDALLRRTAHMLRRMDRMKRMKTVLVCLNNSHGLLEHEINGILDEEE